MSYYYCTAFWPNLGQYSESLNTDIQVQRVELILETTCCHVLQSAQHENKSCFSSYKLSVLEAYNTAITLVWHEFLSYSKF